MKRVSTCLLLLTSATLALHQNDGHAHDSDFKERSSPYKYEMHTAKKYNTILSEEMYNVNSDDSRNLNSFKIPSLMDSSDSIGLLSPSEIDFANRCFPEPRCHSSARFRTIDGSCNNLRFPIWGQANTAHSRIIQANYSDGNNKLRRAVSGRQLPNSRYIRQALFKNVDKPSYTHNLFLMQFGQTIAHDTALSLSKTTKYGQPLKCCNSDGSTPKILPKECLSILSNDDPVTYEKRCSSVPRKLDTSDLGCSIKPVRQQIKVTSFIDASLLYGSDNSTASSLRTFIDGKLARQVTYSGKSFLPNVKNSTETCNVVHENTVCYTSGDIRVNQHPGIAVQTTSLLRLHNLLCDEFKTINPWWDDQRLYQESRRLLIAMYQHVTYNEFVPILVGRDYAWENKLLPLHKGFNNNYDEFLNPTTFTSFSAAAYRALHSQIQGFIDLVNEARRVTSTIRLSDFFSRVDIVQRNENYDSFIRGLLTQQSQGQDQYFTAEITEFLNKIPNIPEGSDLISIDLERGRDFGEPSYNTFRQLCGLVKARTFEDLTDQISKKNVDVLAELYEHVDDIDFYAAGILEEPKPGAVLGHTFRCVIGEMFFRWKFGDRFYYEFGNQQGSFNLDQLNEIRKTKSSLIMCMTSDIKSVQKNAFEVPCEKNPLVSCNSIQRLDLVAWKEEYEE